jgi:aspartyl-tRNA(Asn)/glutamyl-tRNA(Gln) amidotransferase subunit A
MQSIDYEGAMSSAAAASRRWLEHRPLSPIDGLPIAVKSNIAMRGLNWTAGIKAYQSRTALDDADSVRRLRAAGAVIIGTAQMDEAALGAAGDNHWTGRISNPWNTHYSVGGSSGGSAAAVAAGFCAAALGTDTIGSVRIPAAYCGLFGLRPSHGLISMNGVVPLSSKQDTIGILAWSTGILTQMLQVLSETLVLDSSTATMAQYRIALLNGAPGIGIAPEVLKTLDGIVDRLNHAGIIVSHLAPERFDLQRWQKILFSVAEIEGAKIHQAALQHGAQDFSPALFKFLSWGARQGPDQLDALTFEINQAAKFLQSQLAEFDVLILPATPHGPFRHDQTVPVDQAGFMTLASITGLPACTIPVAAGPDGLPNAIQILAKNDATCLTVAESLRSLALDLI